VPTRTNSEDRHRQTSAPSCGLARNTQRPKGRPLQPSNAAPPCGSRSAIGAVWLSKEQLSTPKRPEHLHKRTWGRRTRSLLLIWKMQQPPISRPQSCRRGVSSRLPCQPFWTHPRLVPSRPPPRPGYTLPFKNSHRPEKYLETLCIRVKQRCADSRPANDILYPQITWAVMPKAGTVSLVYRRGDVHRMRRCYNRTHEPWAGTPDKPETSKGKCCIISINIHVLAPQCIPPPLPTQPKSKIHCENML
jgi:hypothetical protein